jgi:hypothetical protein
VADVPKATATAKKLGAFIMHGPADVPGGKITMATDPQGVMFAVHQVIPTAPARTAPMKKRAAAKRKTAGRKPTRNAKKPASKAKKAAPKKKRAGTKK